MAEPPFDAQLDVQLDVQRGHRFFAVELNNIAWDLIEAESRSPADVERMLHAAHGSCFHWLQVGDLVNHLRAQTLLATAYVKAALAEPAVRHAERCLELSREAADRQSEFDRACAHGCAAAAYAVAGQHEKAQSQHYLAKAAADQLNDQSDRDVFTRLYPAPR